ncbi:MAG TPA: NADH-quinone oxidoreductase subunit N [Candidatus Binataceae bacterium]|nr:NADH-quinone oxidoreductase subunit N [Candidatus Binataceae bacterium]
MMHFNLSTVGFSWLPILPLLAVALGAIVVMLVGVKVDDEDSAGLGFIALIALLAAFILTLFTFGQNVTAFNGSLVIDNFAAFFELLIEVAAALTVAMSLEYAADAGLGGAEYYALVLFGVFGMMLLAAAGDLIAIFLGFETMSIAVYALAGFVRRDPKSNEAALKYFLLGAFSTGFLLYGIALVYGAMGTIRLEPIRAALGAGIGAEPLLLPGLGLILIGFGFKVAAVPFHMWTPDAYEGAPTPITGFMAVGVKVAAFAGFMRIFMASFGPISAQWSIVLWVIAAITMTAGNVIALVQNNIKRMLAYSAIAHAGYILVGMAAAGGQAGAAILYYLLGYAFTNLGAFAIVIAVEQGGQAREDISSFRGLARRHPGLAAAMALFLLSLVGVPPLAGFVGKFYVFSAALNEGLVTLVIIAAINSVISAYYYIRVIVAMYMQESGARQSEPLSLHPGLLISISAAALAVIAIGVYPQPYMGAAVNAYASAISRAALHATASLR